MRVARQLEARGVYPPAGEGVQLLDKHLRIDDDAGPDDRDAVRIENAGRNEVKRIPFAFDHDRVAGVIAALVADDEVGVLGKQVRDLALALVAPLDTDEDDAGH